MKFLTKPLIYLLAIPAVGVGWIAGGIDRDPKIETLPADSSSLTATEQAAQLPDFSAPDGNGHAPSFVDVSLRILNVAKTGSLRELRQLNKEVDDARYETDPGYELARSAVEVTYRDRFPATAADEIGPSSRQSFFSNWGYQDLAVAFKTAMTAEPANHRLFMVGSVFNAGASTNPELALRLLRSISDPTLRNQVAWSPVTSALRAEPSLYKQLAQEFPQLREQIYTTAFGAMAAADSATALAELDGVPAIYREKAQAELLRKWAEKDHAAALAWAHENNAPLPPALFHSWAKADPVAALESALAGNFVQSRYGGSIDSIIATATENNPANQDAVAEWLTRLEDENLRGKLSVGLLFGDDEPSGAVMKAAQLAAELPNRSYDTFQSLNNFLNRIKDSQARRDWIQSLTPIASRGLMSTQAGKWLREDASAFGAYVESLPSARARASFLNGALRHQNSQRDHPGLRKWAQSKLDSETLRHLIPKE